MMKINMDRYPLTKKSTPREVGLVFFLISHSFVEIINPLSLNCGYLVTLITAEL